MPSHSLFSERLTDLIAEQEITTERLAGELGIGGSTIRSWRLGRHNISLANAVRLADYFDCSLEFLIGQTENKLDFIPHPAPPFYERLRQVMGECGITWYRIVKDGIVSDNNLSTWKNGASPYLQSVIDLADYFELTLDFFVGREKQ